MWDYMVNSAVSAFQSRKKMKKWIKINIRKVGHAGGLKKNTVYFSNFRVIWRGNSWEIQIIEIWFVNITGIKTETNQRVNEVNCSRQIDWLIDWFIHLFVFDYSSLLVCVNRKLCLGVILQ